MNWFLLALGAGYLYLTYQLPSRSISGDPGVKLMPYVIGVLTVAFTAYHTVQDLRKSRPPVRWRSVGAVAAASLIMLAYVGLMNPLGFELATGLFLIATAAFFKPPDSARAWAVIILFAVLATAAVSLLFGTVFNVNLPEARWLQALRG
ncbi:MAG: tripartite tricarboxylate transporter TctB family protein [Clostridia bacterium]|nr:hypothetical protein [Bacillota bacterium]MBO2521196.1 hypothetical protein [Bacillota bacterium]